MATPLPAVPVSPTVDDVDRIISVPDLVLRNLLITQAYHGLSAAFAVRLGPGANWCTYATWASKQAGQTIRGEDLARVVEGSVASSPAVVASADAVTASARGLGTDRDVEQVRESAWDVLDPAAALERASDAVSRGNVKVFTEIGREFALFNAACLPDAHPEPDHVTQFVAHLRPGDPPSGQRLLAQAFSRYHRALFETDLRVRAQLLFLANLEIGLHEQTRLQPEIAGALEAAIVDPRTYKARLLRALFPYRGWLARLRLFLVRLLRGPSAFDIAVDALLTEARRLVRRTMTRHLMTIQLSPELRLHLGEDLMAEFPASLRVLDLPELLQLLAQIDPTPDSVLESGAVDWADLNDRMHFITDMFRCYQESAFLFAPPFTLEQAAALSQGRVPAGPL